MKMDITKLSNQYDTRYLTQRDIGMIYDLSMGNPQSEAFWKKNGFRKTGAESKQETYTVVAMQRDLSML